MRIPFNGRRLLVLPLVPQGRLGRPDAALDDRTNGVAHLPRRLRLEHHPRVLGRDTLDNDTLWERNRNLDRLEAVSVAPRHEGELGLHERGGSAAIYQGAVRDLRHVTLHNQPSVPDVFVDQVLHLLLATSTRALDDEPYYQLGAIALEEVVVQQNDLKSAVVLFHFADAPLWIAGSDR
jgi:hypothetical protein